MQNLVRLPDNQKYLPGELLQMFRKRSGLTQAQLAERIGLQSKRMVQSWEAGETVPKSDRLRRLIEFYLANKVFLTGQELAEAQQLWNRVKAFFDATSRSLVSYPVFDRAWFEAAAKSSHHPISLANPPKPLPIKEVAPEQAFVGDNLPVAINPLFGRERELTETIDLINGGKTRLLTLSGTAGTGKTRLALKLATELAAGERFGDGIFWIKLASLHTAELLIPQIAQTLGLKEQPGRDLTSALKEYLYNRRILLVLDNFEQIIEAARYLADLLAYSHHLQIIVTSRTILRIYGEQVYALTPLALPPMTAATTFEQIRLSPAIQLFEAEARRVEPRFRLTAENAITLLQICTKLDGLPLALELAAARIKLFSPHLLLKKLSNRFELLTGGASDLPPRQQTLLGALDWSYSLLDEDEKQLFRLIAIFAGSMTLSAVEAVTSFANVGVFDVLKTFESLLDKSLLQLAEISKAESVELEPRFVILETLREYALKRLAEHGEVEQVRQAHSRYFLALAEEAEPKIREVEQAAWLDLLEAEHANFRSALEWLVATKTTEHALRLAGALWWFWNVRGYLSEGQRWLELCLAADEKFNISPNILAKAYHGRAALLGNLGQYNLAEQLMQKALELRRNLGDIQAVSICLHNLGVLSHYQDNYPAAVRLHQESLALKRQLGFKWGIAHSLDELGIVASLQGDYALAKARLTESRELFTEIGDTYSLACVLSSLGRVVMFEENYPEAAELYREGLTMAAELGNNELTAEFWNNQGLLALYQGNLAEAATLFEQSRQVFDNLQQPFGLALSLTYLGLANLHCGNNQEACALLKASLAIKRQLGRKEAVAWSLEGLARVAAAENRFSFAIRLLAAAQRERTAIAAVCPPQHQREHQAILTKARQLMTEAEFSIEWAAGQVGSVEDLLA